MNIEQYNSLGSRSLEHGFSRLTLMGLEGKWVDTAAHIFKQFHFKPDLTNPPKYIFDKNKIVDLYDKFLGLI